MSLDVGEKAYIGIVEDSLQEGSWVFATAACLERYCAGLRRRVRDAACKRDVQESPWGSGHSINWGDNHGMIIPLTRHEK